MSCIAGRLRWDLLPLHPDGLDAMLAAVQRRGPHGNACVAAGPALLGQAFLRTGSSAAEQVNRLTLDGKTWLVADARIDNRAALLKELRGQGLSVEDGAPHAELILHAYRAWGDAFLDHLLGDYAFALWDDDRQVLICVRDRFGVRPFFFAELAGEFVFASDAASLLALPSLPRVLDETAVADFLLLGTSIDADRTIYSAIRCLPPGCRLQVSAGQLSRRSYWAGPRVTEVRYPHPSDYVERFKELFDQAVVDRLPEGPLGISLSAGMDSSSIAAVAARHGPQSISAYHVAALETGGREDETDLTRDLAHHLGLRLVTHHLADYALFRGAESAELRTALPSPAPHLSLRMDMYREMKDRGETVVLSGFQGDAVMLPSRHYYSDLLRSGRWLKFAQEATHHLRGAGNARGMSLRTVWRRPPSSPSWKPSLPDWIQADFAERVRLRDRWDDWWTAHQTSLDTASQLSAPWAHREFELAEVLQAPVQFRYPFLDLRLIEFLMGVPNFVRSNKWVLRQSMRGGLPEAVLTRAKTGAAGDPLRRQAAEGRLDVCDALQGLTFVEGRAYQRAWANFLAGDGLGSTWTSWLLLQPIALAKWMYIAESST